MSHSSFNLGSQFINEKMTLNYFLGKKEKQFTYLNQVSCFALLACLLECNFFNSCEPKNNLDLNQNIMRVIHLTESRWSNEYDRNW